MTTESTSAATFKQYLTISIVVLVLLFGIFSLDKDIHSFKDLFKPGNLFGLIVYYFIPTLLICVFLFKCFLRRNSTSDSLLLSLATGIPISLTLVISILYNVMQILADSSS